MTYSYQHDLQGKSSHFNTVKRQLKMLFSCFGRKAHEAAASDRSQRPHRRSGRRKPAKAEGADLPRKKRKVVVVGDGECGKTCLLQRFCRDTYNVHGYLPTVFDTDVIDVQLEKNVVELMITDTAGQEDYDRLRPYSYPGSDVVIICFSVDNPDSLENVRLNWLPEVRYFCGNVPVLLVGNKMDLRFQGEGEEVGESTVSSDDFLDFPGCSPSAALIKQGPVKPSAGKKMAAEVGAVGYFETSALLDQGVAEVFQAATRAALASSSASRSSLSSTSKWSKGVSFRRGGSAGLCRRKSSFLERIGMKKRRV